MFTLKKLTCWWCGKKGKGTNVSANLFSTHYQVPHGASSSKAIEPQSQNREQNVGWGLGGRGMREMLDKGYKFASRR